MGMCSCFKCDTKDAIWWKACCAILSSLGTTKESQLEVVFPDCKRYLLMFRIKRNPLSRVKKILTFSVRNYFKIPETVWLHFSTSFRKKFFRVTLSGFTFPYFKKAFSRKYWLHLTSKNLFKKRPFPGFTSAPSPHRPTPVNIMHALPFAFALPRSWPLRVSIDAPCAPAFG